MESWGHHQALWEKNDLIHKLLPSLQIFFYLLLMFGNCENGNMFVCVTGISL
jgi:hypothetical protein